MSELLSRQEMLDIFKTMNVKDAPEASSSTKKLLQRPENTLVWVRNEGCDEQVDTNKEKPFYKCLVINDNGSETQLRLANGEECHEQKFLKPFTMENRNIMDFSDMAHKGIKDMIDIDELNHATILYNIFKRYEKDDIYTYVGPTLLAVNPFKRVDVKYPDDKMLVQYTEIVRADASDYYDIMKKLEPHTYAISAYAHKQMSLNATRQAIVISGESGAGKTVSAKQCMFFLTSLGSAQGNEKTSIGDRILSTNPVLEAFGNSKTARNNNSSRFGKYVKLYFDVAEGKVQGAEIKNYLLEKSRVVGAAEKERNYHIFFFMLRGADEQMAKHLGFLKPNGQRKEYPDFKYLLPCNDIPEPKADVEDYRELMKAFNNLGFSEEEVQAILNITAAALHVGQIEMLNTYDDRNGKPATVKNYEVMSHICKLLGIADVDGLITEIVSKGAIKGLADRTPEKFKNVLDSVKTMAKALFDNLFNWLVSKMNLMILPDAKKSNDKAEEERFDEATKTIGLLDIFGFENFEVNQFEQLCINYVNEKLHNLYISSIFGVEKKEMEREGINVELIPPDLKVLKVLKLLDNQNAKLGPYGLFQLVTDKSGGTLGNDDISKKTQDLFATFDKAHTGVSQVFTKVKQMNAHKFILSHSAKDVVYDVKNFLERNADSMSPSLNEFLQTRCDPLVSKMYKMEVMDKQEEEAVAAAPSRSAAAPKSIWGKFSIQIQQLMNELAEPLIPNEFNPDKELISQTKQGKKGEVVCEKCDLHFIRCLKPNDAKVADLFLHAMTLQQITYMGVLESIKVKQENFPYRRTFEDFYKQYELLSPAYADGRYSMMSDVDKSKKDWRKLVVEIVGRVFAPMQPEEYERFYKIGKTKILQMSEVREVLNQAKVKASLVYDEHSAMLKRAYKLMQADTKYRIKMIHIRRIQRQIRKTYQRIQQKRAQEVQNRVQNALVAFKTQIRKDQEEEAAQVIQEVYNKHVFRDHLLQAVKCRQFMMKGIFDLASINRCRKMWICRRLVVKMADRAFKIIKNKKEQESAYRIQRILRGHMERAGKHDIVLSAVKAKVELKQHVSAKKIQKRLKGLIVRRRLYYIELQVSKIQAAMRMKWTRRVFLVIKKNVIILQKAYRRYMARRDKIKERLWMFLKQELQVIENVKAMEYAQLHGNLESRGKAQRLGLLKALTPYSIKKIHFFNRVVDLDILVDLSEIYTHGWSSQWLKALTDSTQSDTPIMNLSAGQSHTLLVNSKQKVFVWGWNDNGQCAKPLNLSEVVLNQSGIANSLVDLTHIDQDYNVSNTGGLRVKQAKAVQDRCLVLLQDTGDVIVWGSNEKGQLGLGHYEDACVPQKIDFFERNKTKVSYIAAGGDLTLCCSEDGASYAWPFIRNGIKQSIPSRMPFSEKTKIQKVACGHNFGFFISFQGLVYSFGEDNSDGQLGLGHQHPTEYPELIQCLRDIGEKIDSIECGFNHAIAKSSLGKIYTWGSSAKGQLGHGHLHSELSPRALFIDLKNNKKVQQIAAGYSHTMVMTENNKEIYWFGTCANLTTQAVPIQYDFARYMPDLFKNQGSLDMVGKAPTESYAQMQDFAIVKIMSSWSKTMSVSNMLIADLRAVNQDVTYSKLISTLKTLNQSWDPNDVMPPYIDIIANYFPANIMRKFKSSLPKSAGQFPAKASARR